MTELIIKDEVVIRDAVASDEEALTRFLSYAANWDPARPAKTIEQTLSDDRNLRYIQEWGQPGDFGVLAVRVHERAIGAAWARHLSPQRPGYGFVSADVPELSIGVEPHERGRGVGAKLLRALDDAAQRRGVRAMSLSVELTNPAWHLYERSGYESVSVQSGSAKMLRVLGKRHQRP